MNVCNVAALHKMRVLRRQGVIYEHVPTRSSLSFLLNDAELDGDVVHVYQKSSVRVYDPELNRSRESIPVTAQLGHRTGRLELKGMPPAGWCVNANTGSCPCLYNAKYGACVHSLLVMRDRSTEGEREKFCYRGLGREKQGAGRRMYNKKALDNECS